MAAELKNQAKRKRLGRLRAVLMLAALLAGTAGFHRLPRSVAVDRAPPKTAETVGGPFALVDARHLLEDRVVSGRYLLVCFGYRGDADACPTTRNAITRAITLLGPRAADVQPMYIPIDPRHDAPARPGLRVARVTPALAGLTASPAARRAVENAYRVVARFGPGGTDRDSVLYLLAPNGEFLTPLPPDGSAARIAADLHHYLG